ncbi:MAG: TlpA disulfide reductase family protein [Myxococcota bacterium]
MTRLAMSLGLVLLGACQGKGGAGKADAAASVSQAVPELSGKTTDGKPIALADYRGKVVLLNVWASWCKPCRQELPELRTLHHAYGDDFVVLGVSVDKPAALRTVQGLMREFEIDYPVLFDADGVSVGIFNITGYPTSFVLGRDGAVRWRRNGIIMPHDSAADAEIKAALAAS